MAMIFFPRVIRACFCFAILLCVATAPSFSYAAAPKGENTRILSEKMTYDSAENQVIFEGKVHVTRPNMEIWSETLTLILDNSEKKASSGVGNSFGVNGGGKVERIIAERNVRIKQDNKLGTCGKATYFVNAGKIVMEQSPVLVDNDNRIKGRVINYFTETGKSQVIGDVDVQFSTNDNKEPSLPGASPAAGQSSVNPASSGKAGQ